MVKGGDSCFTQQNSWLFFSFFVRFCVVCHDSHRQTPPPTTQFSVVCNRRARIASMRFCENHRTTATKTTTNINNNINHSNNAWLSSKRPSVAHTRLVVVRTIKQEQRRRQQQPLFSTIPTIARISATTTRRRRRPNVRVSHTRVSRHGPPPSCKQASALVYRC